MANIERRHVTVAFASIAEFDKVAQQLNSPVELMELLAEYFSVILSEIADAEGTLSVPMACIHCCLQSPLHLSVRSPSLIALALVVHC